MSNKRDSLFRTALTHTAASVFLLIFTCVYFLFSHEVKSAYMTGAIPVPFLLGTLPFLLLRHFTPSLYERRGYRLFANVHHSGIALLVVAMLLRGVLDIAGGTSDIAPWFFIIAFPTLAAGVLLLIRLLLLYGKASSPS